MLLSLIVALGAFFGSLGIASKYLDSIADRIAPDLKSGMKPYRPEKVRAMTLLRRVAQGIAVTLLLRPIFARGATPKERAVLLMLNVAGALSLGYLLLWSAWQGHAG